MSPGQHKSQKTNLRMNLDGTEELHLEVGSREFCFTSSVHQMLSTHIN